MSGFALVRHALWRARTLVLIVALILGAFQWLITLAARTFDASGAFKQILSIVPPMMRALAGDALVPMMSFGGMVTIGYFHLIVQAALMAVAIGLTTQTASEIELHQVDLLMSRPVSRAWLVWRSLAALLVATVTILGVMALGTWSGLHFFAPEDASWPEPRLVLSLILNLGLLMLVWGAVALAIATLSRRRVTAIAIAGLAALVAFLLDYLARVWDPMKKVAWISPFHYVRQMELVAGGTLELRDIAVLLGITVAFVAVAFVAIARRDL